MSQMHAGNKGPPTTQSRPGAGTCVPAGSGGRRCSEAVHSHTRSPASTAHSPTQQPKGVPVSCLHASSPNLRHTCQYITYSLRKMQNLCSPQMLDALAVLHSTWSQQVHACPLHSCNQLVFQSVLCKGKAGTCTHTLGSCMQSLVAKSLLAIRAGCTVKCSRMPHRSINECLRRTR